MDEGGEVEAPKICEDLCRRSGATGKLIADTHHAAVAVEHGCTMVTTDSDFDRFPVYAANTHCGCAEAWPA